MEHLKSVTANEFGRRLHESYGSTNFSMFKWQMKKEKPISHGRIAE
jgi:hypothetical protein